MPAILHRFLAKARLPQWTLPLPTLHPLQHPSLHSYRRRYPVGHRCVAWIERFNVRLWWKLKGVLIWVWVYRLNIWRRRDIGFWL